MTSTHRLRARRALLAATVMATCVACGTEDGGGGDASPGADQGQTADAAVMDQGPAADMAPPDETPPTITGTTPAAGEVIAGSLPDDVRFTSSELLLPSTILPAVTVTLTADADGVTRDLATGFAFDDPEWVITFDDDPFYGSSGEYTVTLDDSITDTAGNPLAEPYSWSFRRGQ